MSDTTEFLTSSHGSTPPADAPPGASRAAGGVVAPGASKAAVVGGPALAREDGAAPVSRSAPGRSRRGGGLAAMLLQVTSARHVLRRDPDSADEALASAEAAGRRSMQELRDTVTLLRSPGEGMAPGPLPDISQLAELVGEARHGGLRVEYQTSGDLTGIPPAVGLALYRIAQEALHNAARHAPRASTVNCGVAMRWKASNCLHSDLSRDSSSPRGLQPVYGWRMSSRNATTC